MLISAFEFLAYEGERRRRVMSDDQFEDSEVPVADGERTSADDVQDESKSRFGLRDLASKAEAVTNKAASKVGQLKEQAANKAEELKGASFAKLNETLDDFNA